MKQLLKSLWGVIILLLGGAAAYASYNKSKEVKQLKKAIKNNEKEEKEIQSTLNDLDKDRKVNKKEITSLKRKLTNSKKQTEKMEKVYDEDNVDEATAFLIKVGQGK